MHLSTELSRWFSNNFVSDARRSNWAWMTKIHSFTANKCPDWVNRNTMMMKSCHKNDEGANQGLIINHDGSWPIKYHFQNLCILRGKMFFSSPFSLRLWPCVIQNYTMTNKSPALVWPMRGLCCSDQIVLQFCERMRVHSVFIWSIICFVIKGAARSIAQMLNQIFSKKILKYLWQMIWRIDTLNWILFIDLKLPYIGMFCQSFC